MTSATLVRVFGLIAALPGLLLPVCTSISWAHRDDVEQVFLQCVSQVTSSDLGYLLIHTMGPKKNQLSACTISIREQGDLTPSGMSQSGTFEVCLTQKGPTDAGNRSVIFKCEQKVESDSKGGMDARIVDVKFEGSFSSRERASVRELSPLLAVRREPAGRDNQVQVLSFKARPAAAKMIAERIYQRKRSPRDIAERRGEIYAGYIGSFDVEMRRTTGEGRARNPQGPLEHAFAPSPAFTIVGRLEKIHKYHPASINLSNSVITGATQGDSNRTARITLGDDKSVVRAVFGRGEKEINLPLVGGPRPPKWWQRLPGIRSLVSKRRTGSAR